MNSHLKNIYDYRSQLFQQSTIKWHKKLITLCPFLFISNSKATPISLSIFFKKDHVTSENDIKQRISKILPDLIEHLGEALLHSQLY